MKARKRLGKLVRVADALLGAAADVYEHDDAFVAIDGREHVDARRKRDQALGDAILAYRDHVRERPEEHA